jgi:O-antigen/teichoic acid export membrane protein
VSTLLPSNRQTSYNFLAIWVNRLIGIFATVIITPIIVHHFGLELTGVWLMVTQLVSHLNLLDVGFSNSLVRFLAGQRAVEDVKKGSNYLATSFYILAIVGFILLVAAPFISSVSVQSLQLTEGVSGAKALVLLAIASIAISLPMRVGHGLLASNHRFDQEKLWDSLSTIIKLLLILVVFHWFDPGLIHLGMIVFGATVFSVAGIFLAGLRLNSTLSLNPTYFSRFALRDLSSMGGAALVVTFASIILMQTTSMLVGYVMGPAEVPLVAYPLMIFMAITPFMASLQTIITPVAAMMYAKKEDYKLLSTFLVATRYQTTAAFFIILLLLTVGQPLLILWLSGPKLTNEALITIFNSVVILFIGYAFSSIAQIGRSILVAVGGHWPVAAAEMLTAVGGLLLGYVLMRITSLGIFGIPIAVACALFIRGVIWYPVILAKLFTISPIRLLAKGIGRPLLIASITTVIFFTIKNNRGLFLYDSTLALISSHVVLFVVYGILSWYFVVTSNHRLMIRNSILGHIKTEDL